MTTAPRKRVLILPGDGIGPEILNQTRRVVDWFVTRRALPADLHEELFGIPAYRAHGSFLREKTWDEIQAADAILFGAIGSPEYDTIPGAAEGAGLMRMRTELGLFINLRPVRAAAPLHAASPLKPDVLRDTDLVIVRELTGGLYTGKPRGIETVDGVRRGVNTMIYSEPEIERIARAAFNLARTRRKRVCSVDKSNVLEVSRLWREVVQRLRDAVYGDIDLTHLFVDNAAMQLVRTPSQFDVVLTENLFGDILSDIGAAAAGSIGMLPSASMNGMDAGGTARHRALYEPIHGSAPDIAGKSIANPCGAVLSFAMCLRHSFLRPDDAALLEAATIAAIENGARTADIARPGQPTISTAEMGSAILRELDAMAEGWPAAARA